MQEWDVHGRPHGLWPGGAHGVNLLGSKENDLTFSLGWALAQSNRAAETVLEDTFPGIEVGTVAAVRLQEFVEGGGFTDIELESDRVAMILEAKRGWNLRSRAAREVPPAP
jgi:hypothetical protein